MMKIARLQESNNLHTFSASAMVAGFAAGHWTPMDVWQSLHAAIGSDVFNAFTVIDEIGARQQAEASTRRWQLGKAFGPLDGVPVSIKDLVMQQGLPTGRGSRITPAVQASLDAPVVQHLRASGAVLFAKTTTTEMGCSIHSDSPAHGRTLNPLDASRSVGGSSCGAAAQLAAGWAPLAIGSDAGGSVRIPAAYTGIVAFKPSFAQIPMWPSSPFMEFAHLGPMAREVSDIQALMACIAQADLRDMASTFSRVNIQLPQRPVRVGVCQYLGGRWLQSEIAEAMQKLPAQLQGVLLNQQKIELVDIDLADVHTGHAMWTVWCSRVLEAGLDWSAEEFQRAGPDMQKQFSQGQAQSAHDVARARQRLRLAAGQLGEVFAQVDILLTPTTPSTAPLAGDFVVDAFPGAAALRISGNWMAATPFSHPWNLMQQPALSIPWGQDRAGRPFGLQIVGARYSDNLVMDIGKALEAWRKEHA